MGLCWALIRPQHNQLTTATDDFLNAELSEAEDVMSNQMSAVRFMKHINETF